MRPPRLRIRADIDVLHIRARHGERHEVFRLASGRTRVATDAARLVYDLSPTGLLLPVSVHGWLVHLSLPRFLTFEN
jgi:hypothetical protein